MTRKEVLEHLVFSVPVRYMMSHKHKINRFDTLMLLQLALISELNNGYFSLYGVLMLGFSKHLTRKYYKSIRWFLENGYVSQNKEGRKWYYFTDLGNAFIEDIYIEIENRFIRYEKCFSKYQKQQAPYYISQKTK